MPERNPEATCGTCPYWRFEVLNEGIRTGQCRRHAPQPGRVWDNTSEGVWCGEHPDFFMPEAEAE